MLKLPSGKLVLLLKLLVDVVGQLEAVNYVYFYIVL